MSLMMSTGPIAQQHSSVPYLILTPDSFSVLATQTQVVCTATSNQNVIFASSIIYNQPLQTGWLSVSNVPAGTVGTSFQGPNFNIYINISEKPPLSTGNRNAIITIYVANDPGKVSATIYVNQQ